MARAARHSEPADGIVRLAPLRGHQTLEEMAYASLRASITAGELRPGHRISVSDAARQLGVSRLPVIHALRTLASQGFVVIHPHRDVVVANATPEELRGRYLILSELEGLATREALPKFNQRLLAELKDTHDAFREVVTASAPELSELADHRFHAVLWNACGIRQLVELIETLWDQGAFDRSLFAAARYAAARIDEHERILRAAQAGDSVALADAIRHHRLSGLDRVMTLLAQRR